MSAVWQQLASAYARQLEIYRQVLGLVDRQRRHMADSADPRAVVGVCGQVEALVAQAEVIDQGVAPAKVQWEETREDPKGELGAVLSSIELVMEEIADAQEQVQQRLLEYMKRQKERTEGARARVNSNRARRLYGAGGGGTA
ncbi:MAG: hypothetical protein ACYS8K_00500 [Planctomycetota bacterium]|jgi:hypothetical protein